MPCACELIAHIKESATTSKQTANRLTDSVGQGGKVSVGMNRHYMHHGADHHQVHEGDMHHMP